MERLEVVREAAAGFEDPFFLFGLVRSDLLQGAMTDAIAELTRLREENEEWEASFDLYTRAIHRATERFLADHPEYGDLTYPDTADNLHHWMGVKETENTRLRAALDGLKPWMVDYQRGDHRTIPPGIQYDEEGRFVSIDKQIAIAIERAILLGGGK